MRYLFILSLLVCFSAAGQAQHGSWYVSTDIGLSASNLDRQPDLYYYGTGPGILINVSAWKRLGKHWQLGLSAASGRQNSRNFVVNEFYNNNNNLIRKASYAVLTNEQQYNFSPSLFIRYQANFTERSYVYAGVVAGTILIKYPPGQKSLGHPLTGVDAGIAIGINKSAKFTINHGWRMYYADLDTRTYNKYSYRPGDGYYISYYEDSYQHFFNFSIGIVAEL